MESLRKYVKFKVNCPATPGAVEDMQILFLEDFPVPCNGCENMSGADICNQCIAEVTMRFYHNPGIDISEPLTLSLSKRDT